MTTLQEAIDLQQTLLTIVKERWGKDDIATQDAETVLNVLRTALAQQGEPCDMGEMCINCQPRGANGECPDASAPAPQAQEPAPQPAQGEPTGCACRWDADDNRVATCARHQGWLDVVGEWYERAKAAEAALQSAQPKQEPLTGEAIYSIVFREFKCVPLPYDIRLTRAIEASHGINGMVEAATRPAIDAAIKQGGQHDHHD